MKKLLILFSILFAFICCKNSVSAPKSEGSQIIGGGSVSNGLNTSLPTWNISYTTIPQEYWGKYYMLDDTDYATVTDKDITFYYKDYDGSFLKAGYFHVFDKSAEYLGNNTWNWKWDYDMGSYTYKNRNKYDFRTSLISEYIKSIELERNEKGQRIFIIDGYIYIHEDDINSF